MNTLQVTNEYINLSHEMLKLQSEEREKLNKKQKDIFEAFKYLLNKDVKLTNIQKNMLEFKYVQSDFNKFNETFSNINTPPDTKDLIEIYIKGLTAVYFLLLDNQKLIDSLKKVIEASFGFISRKMEQSEILNRVKGHLW